MTGHPRSGFGRTYPIVIVPYDPAWPGAHEREAERVRAALGPALRVEHVGSTAVPGLAAKPVIDMQVSVASLEPWSKYGPALEAIGYEYRPDDELDHRFFARDVDGVRTHQIHVCQAGGEWERRHLAFRDLLRANPDVAAEYERLKRQLAHRFAMDMDAYLEGKDRWIRPVEERLLPPRGPRHG